MKKFSMILISTLMLFSVNAFADDYTGGCEYIISKEEVMIAGFYGDTTAEIPETIEGYPVTSISSYAFTFADELEYLTIPKTVKTIGEDAFVNCFSLKNITVAQDNENYSSENGVLFNKSKTEIIQYPAGKEDENYEIPQGVTQVGKRAFYKALYLAEIDIAESVEVIGESAFEQSAIQTISGGVGLTTISKSAFAACDNIESVHFFDNLTEIGESAFWCCGVKSVTFGKNLTILGDSAFFGTGLESVVIPGTITDFGAEVFGECYELKSAVIEKGITVIPEFTFSWCEMLESVTFYDINKVEMCAFDGCFELKDVYYGGSVDEWLNISKAEGNSDLSYAVVHCNFGKPQFVTISAGEREFTVSSPQNTGVKIYIAEYDRNGNIIAVHGNIPIDENGIGTAPYSGGKLYRGFVFGERMEPVWSEN